MQKIHLAIEGVSCGHRVARVQRTLQNIGGVRVASILSPILASAAMAFSSVSVVTNSLRPRNTEVP